ncbi:MAG: C25 family peptidase propeptide domain-containing protein, partial [candidate division Zixibacteria bacterium]|nr:C25 family peptidase propeptide domain-containing protein [candidate division Zixibacteria bacterium]
MEKKLLITMVTLLLVVATVSAEHVVTGNNESNVNIIVEESNDARTVIRFEISAFDKEAIDIDGDLFYQIRCGREGIILNAEEPAVPRICRSLVIPDDAKMAVKVLSAEYTDFPETPVVPSKGNLLRTVNPEDIPYVLGPVYASQEWYPSKLADIR